MPKYLSPSEVSSLLGICLKQMYKLLNKGEIPGSFKLGGIWMIDSELLISGLASKAQKPKPHRESAGNKNRHNL